MKNLSDLRIALYQEHLRDRRLTIISYTLLGIVVIIVVALLFFAGADLGQFVSSFFNSGQDDGSAASTYYKLTPFIILAFAIGYPAFKFWKISNRSQKIEELLSRIEKGVKPAGIDEQIEYKMSIPLLKVNLKMYPVTFARIFLGSDSTPYMLPISSAYVADMRTILSGANVTEINQIKNELYEQQPVGSLQNNATETEEIEENNFTPTPIKSVDELRAFIDKEMKEDIASLETSRKSTNKAVVMTTVAGVVLVGGFAAYNIFNIASPENMSTDSNPLPILIPVIIGCMVVAAVFNFMMKKRVTQNPDETPAMFGTNDFKEKVVGRIVHFINPSLHYASMGYLGLNDIYESGLFSEQNYTVEGSDMISGRHSGVPFISCDLSMYRKRNMTKENEAPDCAFSGQLFVARFNKSFSTPVYVIPKKNKFDMESYLTTDMGESVKLEDPEFMKQFNVYSPDQLTARYILTPSLMERIKKLASRTSGAYNIAFYNNTITIADNTGERTFEESLSRSITKDDNQLLIDFYNKLCNQFAIIDDLKLNINIWKK